MISCRTEWIMPVLARAGPTIPDMQTELATGVENRPFVRLRHARNVACPHQASKPAVVSDPKQRMSDE